jgi:uncharacterized protein
MTDVDGAGLRVLTVAECMHRLASVNVGRVALSHRALPAILPVHFHLADDGIILQTREGTTLHRSTDGTVVAFEAEGPAGAADPEWSVVVHGLATHRAVPWADGAPVTIVIGVQAVTGREVLDAADPMAPPMTALARW